MVLDFLLSFPSLCSTKSGLATLAVVVVGAVLYLQRSSKEKREQRQEKLRRETEKNVVVLHQFPRLTTCPNASPFPIKLETFLRATGVKYVSDFEDQMSDKGKSPWITLNGKEVADSQLAMETIKSELGVGIGSEYSKEELAVGNAFRLMLEDHLYFILIVDRYITFKGEHLLELFVKLPMPKLILKLMLKFVVPMMMNRVVYAQGQGRHSRAETETMGEKCLESLSLQLGSKPFLLGSTVSEVDCTIFGFMCMLLYASPKESALRVAVEKKFTNLVEHTKRMKDLFYKDWDQIIIV